MQFAAAAAPRFSSRELQMYSRRLVALLKLLVDTQDAIDLKVCTRIKPFATLTSVTHVQLIHTYNLFYRR